MKFPLGRHISVSDISITDMQGALEPPAPLDTSRSRKGIRVSCLGMAYSGVMERVNTTSEIDWAQCELIECVPGKVSGKPVVRGTRIMPEAIVGSYDLGETIEELREGFPTLSAAQIKRLIEFAHAQREQCHP